VVPMRRRVMEYNELQGFAEFRFEEWAKKRWPQWDKMKEDIPEEFERTHDCPECRQSSLVMGYHPKPFCFWCNVPVDATNCENCGRTHLIMDGCCTIEDEPLSRLRANGKLVRICPDHHGGCYKLVVASFSLSVHPRDRRSATSCRARTRSQSSHFSSSVATSAA
jgi:hypothetical protein